MVSLRPNAFAILIAATLVSLLCIALATESVLAELAPTSSGNEAPQEQGQSQETTRSKADDNDEDDDEYAGDDQVESTPGNPFKTYGVIVDCGSSGTRAHLYEWDTDKGYPELLHDLEPMRDDEGKPITKKIVPGLSSLAEHPDKASDYIQPIMDFITAKIPAFRFPFTGVYILATAGMRLLDDKTQKTIMHDVAAHLKNNYNFAHVTTSVISGADEGMYQWISVNAKAKRFLEANTNPKTPTFAVVEMGGASIQVTYQLRPGMEQMLEHWLRSSPDALAAVKSQIVEPQISRAEEEHNFKLCSVTFLGFGGNSAREAYIDLLIKREKKWFTKMSDKLFSTHYTHLSKDKTLEVLDPCMPKGSSESMLKPMSMLSAGEGQTIGFHLEDNEPTFNVTIIGTGKFNECKLAVKQMLQRAKDERMNCKPDEPCSMALIGHNFIPWHRFDFLGLSDFYYTTNSMLDASGAYNHEKIIGRTKKICNTSYKNLLEQFPDVNKHDDTRARRECFKSMFIDTFLLDGLSMPTTFEKFETVNKIRGDDLEWTLGAILDKSLSLEMATVSQNSEVL